MSPAAAQRTDRRSTASHKHFLELGRALGVYEPGTRFEFAWAGRRLTALWRHASKNTPSQLRLSTDLLSGDSPGPRHPVAGPPAPRSRPPLAYPGPLLLRVETGTDRFGKRLGLNREFQTGEVRFDRRAYIETEAPDEVVRSLLAEPQLRQTVVGCFEWGASSVQWDAKGMLVVEVQTPDTSQLEVDAVQALADLLCRIADALPPLRPLASPWRAPRWRRLLVGGSMVGAIASVPAVAISLTLWQLLDAWLPLLGVVGGLLLWALSLPLLVLGLRGHSTSLRDLMVSTFSLLMLLPLGSGALLMGLNCGLDTSPPRAHDTSITGMRVNRGKSTSYHIILAPWRPGQAEVSVRVPPATYSRFRTGQRVALWAYPGWLGQEWFHSLAPHEPRP